MLPDDLRRDKLSMSKTKRKMEKWRTCDGH